MIKEANCYINDESVYMKIYQPDKSEGKYPTVILSHGLSLNHTFMIPYAEKLLKKNIVSVVFDFRGGGYDSKSDGNISDMTLNSEMDDLNQVLDFVRTLDYVDKDNIYLAGHSQGGLISSLIAPTRSNDIRGLFLFAPAYVIPFDVKEYPDNMREKNVMRLMPEYLGTTYVESVNSIDVYNTISRYDGDVYIFQGKKDTRVPVSYVIKAGDVLSNSHLILFDEEEHRFTDETKDVVVDRISEVIADNRR